MTRFFLLFFLFCTNISAQFIETWDNSDFSSPNTWFGDHNKFEIKPSENILKLNAVAETSQAHISTKSNSINDAIWEFSVSMDFNPSSSNYTKIFIITNQSYYNDSLEGYYVMIGNTQDEVSMWKRQDGENTKIIDGQDKILNNSSNLVFIRVIRDDKGNWQLFSKTDNTFTLEGEAFDDSIISSSYFGIFCKYTSTRSNKFTFGQINVSGESYKDENPPIVTSHQLIAGNQFSIELNEVINTDKITTSYFKTEDGRLPDRIDASSQHIDLYFDEYLSNTQNGKMLIKNIEDESGNAIRDSSLIYSFERINLVASKVINNHSIVLTFNKKLDKTSIENISIESSLDFYFSELHNDSSIVLKTHSEFIPNKVYNIEISHVKALFGDITQPIAFDIIYRKPERFDVILSEFMPDPTPNVNLYESEFIELYNRRDYSINLDKFILSINNKEVTLPSYNLSAHAYVIILDEGDYNKWPAETPIISLHSLPTLPNTGSSIILSHPNGTVSDALKYPLHINDDSFKNDGGWSFEKIDINNQQHNINWQYSINLNGGTPGLINSVNAINPDTTAPKVTHISYIDTNSFEIFFSEGIMLDEDELTESLLTNSDLKINNLQLDTIFQNKIFISFKTKLNTKTEYSSQLSQQIKDYADNAIKINNMLRFGVPEPIENFDLCINEVLFNPVSGSSDFIEIHNRSAKVIHQHDIHISSLTNETPNELMKIDSKNQLLFPNDYLVLTEDASTLFKKHNNVDQALVNEANIPSLSDNDGNIAIVKNDGSIIDYFEYKNDMHFELLRDKEGVSLERINPNAETNNRNNWHSASKQSGYATPTKQNSQYARTGLSENKDWVNLSKKEFSPNSDGSDDFVQLQFSIEEPGWTANISVFNKYGQLIKTLANNELLGTHSHITWDGTNNNYSKTPVGIYIILVDLFSSSGKKKQEKLTVVVSAGGRK